MGLEFESSGQQILCKTGGFIFPFPRFALHFLSTDHWHWEDTNNMRCQFLYPSIFFSSPKWLELPCCFSFLEQKLKLSIQLTSTSKQLMSEQCVMGIVEKIGRNAEQRNNCDHRASANTVFELVFEKWVTFWLEELRGTLSAKSGRSKNTNEWVLNYLRHGKEPISLPTR